MGLWIPCAGSVSPWNTYLGSEEYEPDAYCIATATSFNGPEATSLSKCMGSWPMSSTVGMMRYFFPNGNFTIEDVKNTSIFQPYMYGRATEIKIKDNDGNVDVFKHMALGRHSYELIVVMPDNKTVYSSDDGTNTAFWKFVANTPGDLSSGTLYGAKLTQTDTNYGGDFAVSWIQLGSSNTSDILALIKSGIKFTDIFEVAAWNSTANCSTSCTPASYCPAGYTSISKRDNNLGASCLKLKAGMETAAAFLESRRYLAYLNGTVELSKFEGLAVDPINKKMYGAMSQNRYGMEDFKSKGSASTTYDIGGPNDVRLPYNPCGCVYAFDMTATWDVTRMYGELCGTPVTVPSRFSSTVGTKIGNRCLDLAEPDNIAYIPGHNMLIIGEDVNENQFDYLYQYDLATKTKVRIFSANYGAETTSPYWFPNLKAGWSYLGAVIQHPYDESDAAMASAPGASGSGAWIGNWAFRNSDFADGSVLRFLPISQVKDNATGHYGQASAGAYAQWGGDDIHTRVVV
jgi:secreted PhoX family phosphatase